MEEDELDLVETYDLVRALYRRFDSVVVLTYKQIGKDGTGERYSHWSGRFYEIVGMLLQKRESMIRQSLEDECDVE